jgi:DHA2 family multidrug resistance protein
LSADAALASIGKTVDAQAHMLALDDFSAVCTMLFAATLIVVWLARYRQAR